MSLVLLVRPLTILLLTGIPRCVVCGRVVPRGSASSAGPPFFIRMDPGHKPFSEELHTSFDIPGREAVVRYLRRQGWVVFEDPYGQYSVDLVAYKRGIGRYFIDVEVRPGWEHGKFPFDTIHLPERKKKFLDCPDVVFWSLRKDLKKALIIPGEVVSQYKLVHQGNKYIKSGEYFYDIPVGELKYQSLS